MWLTGHQNPITTSFKTTVTIGQRCYKEAMAVGQWQIPSTGLQHILSPTTAVTGYAIDLWKPSANSQVFIGTQIAESL